MNIKMNNERIKLTALDYLNTKFINDYKYIVYVPLNLNNEIIQVCIYDFRDILRNDQYFKQEQKDNFLISSLNIIIGYNIEDLIDVNDVYLWIECAEYIILQKLNLPKKKSIKYEK